MQDNSFVLAAHFILVLKINHPTTIVLISVKEGARSLGLLVETDH